MKSIMTVLLFTLLSSAKAYVGVKHNQILCANSKRGYNAKVLIVDTKRGPRGTLLIDDVIVSKNKALEVTSYPRQSAITYEASHGGNILWLVDFSHDFSDLYLYQRKLYKKLGMIEDGVIPTSTSGFRGLSAGGFICRAFDNGNFTVEDLKDMDAADIIKFYAKM